ncbi:hypothetical protein [Paraburkholderia ferrariae]|uniref:hypothetical protein n=1 Tax=Paraburkholderia ferrariae TaxID=386056 RepID=UPI0012EBBE3A|nr:hypothetical protein [Paraburkholderia ferrariae]
MEDGFFDNGVSGQHGCGSDFTLTPSKQDMSHMCASAISLFCALFGEEVGDHRATMHTVKSQYVHDFQSRRMN